MATGPGLTFDITEKQFHGVDSPLFAGLHLEVTAGSTVALIGPSGIGKSTLLRILAGIDRDFAGKVLVDGIPAHEAPTPGFVFQDPRLLPWLTAAENIRAADSVCSEEAAQEALSSVGLTGSSQLYPYQLSGGMQRRVALARALSVNAKLLLLDEPFVSLDRPLVSEMHQLFNALVIASRPTVVFVSHLMDDAARLADRVILLDHRPARIVHDVALPVPPAERNGALLEDYRRMLDLG